MDAIGAQEVHFPALLPREPYEASGRWTEYGDNIFRLKDRKGADYLLGPTHEEMFTLTVKDLYSSYKDLPVSLYQIQTKYRDEAAPAGRAPARPRVRHEGLLLLRRRRRRAARSATTAHREAYIKIFDRLGLDYVIVSAMSGAMGGSKSEEFLATAENGEDTYVRCTNCGLRGQRRGRAGAGAAGAGLTDAPGRPRRGHAGHPHHRDPRRPSTRTPPPRRPRLDGRGHAEERPRHAAAPDGKQRAARDRRARVTATSTRSAWAPRSTPPVAEPFTETTSTHHPELVKGLHRPGGARRRQARPACATCSTRASSRAPGGSPAPNEPGRHVFDLVAGRDFTGDGTIEAAEVRAGDPCPSCGHAAGDRPRHRDGPHLPARPKFAEALGPQGPRRERQAGRRHHGLLRHRRLARRRGDRRGNPRRASACAGRGRSRRPTCTSSRPARTTRSFEAAEIARPRPRGGRASTVLYDDRRGSRPGVKFKDAELHRRADDRRRRPRAWPTASSRCSDRRTGERGGRPSVDGRGGRGSTAACGRRRRGTRERDAGGVDAVVFDWGGTLTPWHTIDLHEQWRAYARSPLRPRPGTADELAGRIWEAEDERGWAAAASSSGRARSTRSSLEAGIDADDRAARAGPRRLPGVLGAAHAAPTRDAGRCSEGCGNAASGSACCPTRSGPGTTTRPCSARDGVLDLIDGAVYSSEIPWTKPHPEAFRAAMAARRRRRPGARACSSATGLRRRPRRQVGRHARRPRAAQRHPREPAGHVEGDPDAVVHERLDDLARARRRPERR